MQLYQSILSRYHNCDSTTIRRYRDAFDYDGNDLNYDLRLIRLRYDYDKKLTWVGIEWKQARTIRRSQVVVVS